MAKSKEELIYDIENELVDPTTNKITGERVKARLLDMVDAMGEGGGSSQLEYWKTPSDEAVSAELSEIGLMISVSTKVSTGSDVGILPGSYYWSVHASTIVAFAVDLASKIKYPGEPEVYLVADLLAEIPLADMGCEKITEEEYYTF